MCPETSLYFVVDSNIWIYTRHAHSPRVGEFAKRAIDKAYKKGVILYNEQTKFDLKQALRTMCKRGDIELDTGRAILSDMEARSKFFLFDHKRYIKEHAKELSVCSDYGDLPFLALADASGARAIVSNDRHLRGLGTYKNVVILTAKEFCEER